mgnify:FL=1
MIANNKKKIAMKDPALSVNTTKKEKMKDKDDVEKMLAEL